MRHDCTNGLPSPMVADCHTCKPQKKGRKAMAQPYRQLTYLDRQRIEEGLDRADLLREIARTISRDVSTMSREVKGWIGDHF